LGAKTAPQGVIIARDFTRAISQTILDDRAQTHARLDRKPDYLRSPNTTRQDDATPCRHHLVNGGRLQLGKEVAALRSAYPADFIGIRTWGSLLWSSAARQARPQRHFRISVAFDPPFLLCSAMRY
jgi:hypothetical protein